jgi:hypothetical protein
MGKAISPSCPKELLAWSGIAKMTSARSTGENATLMLPTVQDAAEAVFVHGSRAPVTASLQRMSNVELVSMSLGLELVEGIDLLIRRVSAP